MQLLHRALAVEDQFSGTDEDLERAATLHSLSRACAGDHRYTEAETNIRQALDIRSRILGQSHSDVANSYLVLALVYELQNRYTDAAPYIERAYAIYVKLFGQNHPKVAEIWNGLAVLLAASNQGREALAASREGTAAVIAHSLIESGGNTQIETTHGPVRQHADFFKLHVANLALASRQGVEPETVLAQQAFEIAQRAAQSSAAEALQQLSLRFAPGSSRLGALVRERQDLAALWRDRDKALIGALSKPEAQQEPATITALRHEIAGIEAKAARLAAQLGEEIPEYSAFEDPQPLSVAAAQALLSAGEALVLFLDSFDPKETFIWVLTRTEMRWVRSELGTPGLTREVAALRCGLDAEAWSGDEAAQCAKLLNIPLDKAPKDGDLLPFDLARAHALYKALFGEAEDLLKGKSLIIVPSGPLTQLPFQVLVTAPPASGDYKSAAWLARDHALTVLPAVSSLKALRRVARRSAAAMPMIGFGNPLLDGDQGDPKYGAYFKKRAALARENQSCPQAPARTPMQRLASLFGLRRGVAPMAVRGLADVNFLRAQLPLPETRDELCAVARDLGADPGEMRLGARATEREVKALSASGALAQYRIVHFATHGVLAGQLDAKAEPGLILTPPETASEEDDGYLTASEIAALKLDADWVILSACNTAAGGATGAEALPGLARAFFYAQARALLVSHWEVDSAATVKLITGAVSEIARDKRVGRAEALRRAMLALIDGGKPGRGASGLLGAVRAGGRGGSIAIAGMSAMVMQNRKE